MQISVTKRDILRILSRAQGIAARKSTMPALSCVLLEASGNSLRVSATDLYVGVSGSVPADVTKPGSIALPAKDLFERLRCMGDGAITFAVQENHSVSIKSAGSARKYTMRGMPGDDFPPIATAADGASTLNLEAATILRLITKVQAAVSTDQTRPQLNSVLFEWDGDTVRMVATDGHRLSRMEIQVPGRQASMSLLLPLKAALELRRLCEDAIADAGKDDVASFAISQSASTAYFQTGASTFSAKLTESSFPPYQAILPKSHTSKVTVRRASLSDAIRAVSIAAPDATDGVKLDIDASRLAVSSESSEKGDGSDEVEVDLEGKPIVAGFNSKYLVDALAGVDSENVVITLGGPLDPAVMTDDPPSGLLAVAMPMRLP